MHTWRKVGCCLVAAALGALSSEAETYYLCGKDSGGSSMSGTGSHVGWATTPGGPKAADAATAGNDYVLDTSEDVLRTPTGDYTFLGDSLTLSNGVVALMMTTADQSLTLTNCIVSGPAQINKWGNSGSTQGVAGKIVITDEGVLTFSTAGKSNNDARSLTVSADISGTGTLKTKSENNGGANFVAFSSLKDFTGKLDLQGDGYTYAASRSYHSVNFTQADSFPADASAATADSITIGYGVTVNFSESGSFGENRGVRFTHSAPTIYVASGKTVVFNGTTSGDAGFVKTGAGDLVLSNDTQMVSGTVTVKAGRLFYKPALAKSATIKEDGGTAIELESEAKMIDLSCSGYEGVADGMPHGITVEVTDPVDGAGCTFEWSTDGGVTWSDDKPMFEEAGRRTVHCRVSADGYLARTCQADVFLRHQGTVYVSPNGSATYPYDEPGKAAHDIASALDAVADGQVVSVGAGTYDQTDVVSIGRGISVQGPSDRSAVIRSFGVSLSDGAALSGIAFDGLTRAAASVASGCVVSNCLFRNATAVSAGLYGTLVDCEIRDCTGDNSAVRFYGSNARMIRTKILHVCNTGVAPILSQDEATTLYMEECTVAGCTNAASGGGAVLGHGNGGGSFVLNRCRFLDNTGRYSIGRLGAGGASSWNVYATNCLFASNHAVDVGGQYGNAAGMLWMRNGDFVNCTFADNASAAEAASVFTIDANCKAKVVNGVMSGNGSMTYEVADKLTYDHSLYPEADGTSGNVTGPAVFSKRRREKEPYRLDPSSPGVGGGLLLGWTSGDIDLSGCPRVRGADKVDMGCFTLQTSGFALLLK